MGDGVSEYQSEGGRGLSRPDLEKRLVDILAQAEVAAADMWPGAGPGERARISKIMDNLSAAALQVLQLKTNREAVEKMGARQ